MRFLLLLCLFFSAVFAIKCWKLSVSDNSPFDRNPEDEDEQTDCKEGQNACRLNLHPSADDSRGGIGTRGCDSLSPSNSCNGVPVNTCTGDACCCNTDLCNQSMETSKGSPALKQSDGPPSATPADGSGVLPGQPGQPYTAKDSSTLVCPFALFLIARFIM